MPGALTHVLNLSFEGGLSQKSIIVFEELILNSLIINGYLLLQQGNLPDDADTLLDRPEYWIVAKDVATRPKKDDEFAFTIKRDGAVQISRNNNKATDFLFVDASQSFHLFFELYGTTRQISLLGTVRSNQIFHEKVNIF